MTEIVNCNNRDILNNYIGEIKEGGSLEERVTQWAQTCLHDPELNYAVGLGQLKEAKKTYYKTTYGGRITRLFLILTRKREAQDKVQPLGWLTQQNHAFTKISREDWYLIGRYIFMNRPMLVQEAKKIGEPILTHSQGGLPRSIVVTPEGEIYVLFNQTGKRKNQTAEKKEDSKIGKGAENHAKNAVNFDRGTEHVIVTSKNAFVACPKERLKIIRKLPVSPRFLKIYAVFSAKKENAYKPYLITDKVTTIMDYKEKGLCKKNFSIAQSLLENLVELHKNGIYHRDIKSDNVGIRSDRGYLFDWDRAKFKANLKKTLSGHFWKNTRIAPSWLDKWGRYETYGKADVFSMGIVLAELLSGISYFDCLEEHGCAAGRDVFKNAISSRLPWALGDLLLDMMAEEAINCGVPKRVPTAKQALKRFKKIAK